MGTSSEGDSRVALPKKKFYRQRAHSNPISDHDLDYPRSLYAVEGAEAKEVEFLDVGCGYGGLLVSLSRLFPSRLALGLEIRVKVSDYVMERIGALRAQQPGHYANIACLRANAMKHLPNFFRKAQLSKMFFLYPDPHFKKGKHKWRIINTSLIAEYAYVLRITLSAEELVHLLGKGEREFRPAVQEEDGVVPLLWNSSEEGQKVTRNEGEKFLAVFERIQDPFDDD